MDQVETAAAAIQSRWKFTPRVGIILGTGLGSFARHIAQPEAIPYGDIPHFPCATATGHVGRLVCGNLAGVPVVAMEGRCHIYEGYSPAQVTLGVRVMKRLGARLLIVSNASGGMNPRYRSGDIMVVEDHINLMGARSLVGLCSGPPQAPASLATPYDRPLIDRALEIARREDFIAHCGTYVALTGPNFESRAEYRFLRHIGGDVVGMSTVPEVIAAAQLGLRVLALSTVTNLCLPDALQASSGEEVLAIAATAEEKLRKIVLGIVADEAQLDR